MKPIFTNLVLHASKIIGLANKSIFNDRFDQGIDEVMKNM